MKKVMILGSTGSVGTKALDVAEHLGYEITAISANTNIKLLEKQIEKSHPALVACTDDTAARELKFGLNNKTEFFTGASGLQEMIREADFDICINAIVGMAGTGPSIEVIKRGKTLALANKECIVTAGEILFDLAEETGSEIISVDSEHSAIFQCLQDKIPNKPSRIILTASGGPFFGKTAKELENVTAKKALRHPNWSMGAKITIDSATLMNKGLEIMEAVRLFGVPEGKTEVIIHRESIIHSMVEFEDFSILAQLSVPDMKIPIQYALTYPKRYPSSSKKLDLTKIGKLSFFRPDEKTFKSMRLCRDALKEGGTAPTILNAANEVAVEMFLKGKIGFLKIADIVEEALNKTVTLFNPTIEDIIQTDNDIRQKLLI